jgi:dethiobiotin synthetase
LKAFFVTGTDTAVGKTTVTSAMAAYCAIKKGLDVGVMKPFESGLSRTEKDLLPWDAIRLREASGSQDDLAVINPYTFEAPLAPEAAAEREHVRIDLGIVDRMYNNLLKGHDILFIEGAGGVLVPITKDFFFLDLMKRWNVPTIIVSRLGLGTINHTLLTRRILKQEGVPVAGVILNNNDGRHDLATKTNPDILARYLDVPILGVFPYHDIFAKGAPTEREWLAELVAQHINMTPITG